jgi:heme/copper-type cytochrome/quinol oxidase subunit 2
MKKIKLLVSSAGLFMLPVLVSAQGLLSGGGSPFETFLVNLQALINGVILPFVLALAFLVFVWGMFQYFIAGGANDESKEKGKSLMIWATVAFVFIIIFWGVVNFITGTLGLDTAVPVVQPGPGVGGTI